MQGSLAPKKQIVPLFIAVSCVGCWLNPPDPPAIRSITSADAIKVFSHRAGRGNWPENSYLGLKRSVEHQIDGIEIDINFTKDNQIIVHHNHYLDPRPSNGGQHTAPCYLNFQTQRRFIFDMHLDELTKTGKDAQISCHQNELSFADKNRSAKQQQIAADDPLARILTLSEALEITEEALSKQPNAYQKRLEILIEIKQGNEDPRSKIRIGDYSKSRREKLIDNLTKVINDSKLAKQITIQSFHLEWIKHIKQRQPHLKIAYLVLPRLFLHRPSHLNEHIKTVIADSLELNAVAPYHPVTMDPIFGVFPISIIDPLQVMHIQNQGIRVIPWTANKEEDWLRLAGWGVNGIITDYPVQLAKWLKNHLRSGR